MGWRKIWKILAGTIWLAGLVGFIAMPEDAQKWAKLLSPVSEFISLGVAEVALILGLVVLGIWILKPVWARYLPQRTAKPGSHTLVAQPIPQPDALAPSLLILHDKIRDTERWPSGDGYSVKFRVENTSTVRAVGIGGRIRALEFLQGGRWRPYGHDFAEVPLTDREGKATFDLQGGDENSVYIAKRSTRLGEAIQLCYAKDDVPNTISLKDAWRVAVRLVSDNAPHKDATFELRVSDDGTLVGTLLGNEAAEDESTKRSTRALEISELYGQGVALRNRAASLRILDAATEAKMDNLQPKLKELMREIVPEQTINLDILNIYDSQEHLMLRRLQNPKRAYEFSEFLLRIKKILEKYQE